MNRQIAFLLLLLTPAVAGCSGQSLVEISGHVSLNGKPLPKGEINFLPDGTSKTPSAGAIIADGTYVLKVAPGPKKVKILGFKTVGQKTMAPTAVIDINQQIVPARYNTQTELHCSVEAGNTPYDFPLVSDRE